MSETEHYQITGATAREIAASVERGVRDGHLSAGERLPSVRRLAERLEVSPTTVAAALRDLARRGVVVSEERRGSVVSGGAPVARVRAPGHARSGVRDLAKGNPDPALLPDLRAAWARLKPPRGLYGEEPALAELVELARAELGTIGVPGRHLCLVSGALDGVERIFRAQLRPGDRVAVEDPGYRSALDLLRAQGLVPVPVPLDSSGMLPDRLERALGSGVDAVLITPRGQNPTGAALTEERALALRSVLASAPDVLVVEDDHLGRVAGVDAFTTVAGRSRWAFVRSVAKSLGPDLRLAFLAGDAETVARVEGMLALGPGWVSRILQRTVLDLVRDPAVGKLLDRAAGVYRTRRDALIAALARRGIDAQGRTGMNVWIPVPDETGAVAALLDAGWEVVPGSVYRLESPPAVRVTTSTLDPGDAEPVAAALAAALTPGRHIRAA